MLHPDDGVLQELLDGELAPADEAAVRAHLASCGACTALLDELKETQAEAASIVSRLDLDPPLRVKSPRIPGRRFNLQAAGLAASVLLVASVSLLVLHSRDRPHMLTSQSDTMALSAEPANVVKDSARVDALAPGDLRLRKAAPAPVVPAEENKGALAVVPAAPPEAAHQEAREKEVAAPLTVADAGQRLGWKVRTIEGLAPPAVELIQGPGDSATGVRLRYQLGNDSIVLVQQAATTDVGARRDADSKDEAAGLASEAAPAAGFRRNAAPAAALPTAKLAKQGSPRVWQSEGVLFVLSGSLPADSLDALMQRVR